ncbi:hypothetical protein, partial [Porphyromonas gingivalis]|uniref:hypothetical protein n=1 Tax=Porphyromonas gingivalis TaxID=837 RepID=UPI001F4297B4
MIATFNYQNKYEFICQRFKIQIETIAQRGCSFCSLVPGVFLTILVCFAAWGLVPFPAPRGQLPS